MFRLIKPTKPFWYFPIYIYNRFWQQIAQFQAVTAIYFIVILTKQFLSRHAQSGKSPDKFPPVPRKSVPFVQLIIFEALNYG